MWVLSFFMTDLSIHQFFCRVPIQSFCKPDLIEYLINNIRGKYLPFSTPFLGYHSPDDALWYQLRRMAYEAMRYSSTDTLRVLYKYGYYIDPDIVESHYFSSACSDIACILMSGVILRDANFGRYHPNFIPIPDRLLRDAVRLDRTAAIQVVLDEKSLPKYHMRLLSYSIAMNSVAIVIQILDNTTLHFRKKHFYRAVTRGYTEIVAEFIRRGFDYSRYKKELIQPALELLKQKMTSQL